MTHLKVPLSWALLLPIGLSSQAQKFPANKPS